MNKSIASVSNFLPNYILKNEILNEYGLADSEISQIKLKNTAKHRAVYKVKHNNKFYCLKKVYCNASRLLFLYSAIEWWYRNGINVPYIIPTTSKSKYVSYNGMLFILTPWINGEKFDYDRKSEFLLSALNLAQMHKKAKSFSPIRGSITNPIKSDISKSCVRNLTSLLANYNTAHKTNDAFSKLFMSNFPKYEELAQKACKVASTIDKSKLTKSLCHLDYVNKNLIFDENNLLWVIDFDNCNIDYVSHDISHALRRYTRRDSTPWNIEDVTEWLEYYSKISPLTLDDLKYIYAYVIFPKKTWKLSRDYYRNIKKCNKRSFYLLLEKDSSLINEHLEFANAFANYIEEKFETTIL